MLRRLPLGRLPLGRLSQARVAQAGYRRFVVGGQAPCLLRLLTADPRTSDRVTLAVRTHPMVVALSPHRQGPRPRQGPRQRQRQGPGQRRDPRQQRGPRQRQIRLLQRWAAWRPFAAWQAGVPELQVHRGLER